jgi:tetratricopeptide (TPR) repeat protein
MTHLIRSVVRLPLTTLGAVRRYPLRSIAAVGVLAGLVVFALWRALLGEWAAAKTALAEGRPADARTHLDRCLKVWPENEEAHFLAARSARLTGELSKAEAHLNRCIKLNRGATQAVQLEFLLLRAQSGEVDELASTLFAEVQKGNPETPAILETVATAYIRRLRYRPAYAALSMWIDRQPDLTKPYHLRGWVLERMNNSKGAMTDYLKVLDLDPDHVPARLRVAEMLLEDKQAPEATPHLERLYRQAPTDPMVLARLGMCRQLEGRNAEARKLMEAAEPRMPTVDAAFLVALSNLDLQEDRAAAAEQRLRKVLADDPSDTEALFVLSSALQAQERGDEAAKVLAEYEAKRKAVDRINDMLKDVADSPTATAADYAEIGRLFLSIGKTKFGVYWLEHALESDPGNQVAHRELARHYEAKGDSELAAAHNRMVRSETPPPENKGP